MLSSAQAGGMVPLARAAAGGMTHLDWAGSAAGVLGGLQIQGLSRLLLLPDGCEGDHAELATPSSGALARAQADGRPT